MGGCVTAHWSSSDGHVLPVAGRPLGAAVAAQVLVDASHLVSGHVISHLQVLAGAVRLDPSHVHCLQQVLAVYHTDLQWTKHTESQIFLNYIVNMYANDTF